MQTWAAIDLLKGRVVTLLKGDPSAAREWDLDATAAARRWREEGAHGLHVVDLDRALGTGSNESTILHVIAEAGIPVEVGGGIRSLQDAQAWAGRGASRVVIGTMAFEDPSRLAEIVGRLGPARVAVAIDFRGESVVTNGWTRAGRMGVEEATRMMEDVGAETAIVTAVEKDGTAQGPDFGVYRRLRARTRMKVLASGGIRSADDVEKLGEIGVDGVILGRALYESTIALRELRTGLDANRKANHPVS